MPKVAKFEMPDGRVARFEVPDDYTPEQAQQEIAGMLSELPEKRSLAQKASDLFTGADRETEYTQKLPEFDVPAKFALTRPVDTAKAALGLLTTFDPLKQVSVLKDAYPKLKFFEDEKGNIIVDGREEGAEVGVLNLPGVSARDLIQAGFQVAAFTPAGKAGAGALSGARAAGRVGVASAGTQLAQDLVGQAAGSQANEIVSNNSELKTVERDRGAFDVAADVDYTDVAIAGALGGAFEGIAQVVGPKVRSYLASRKGSEKAITDEVRQEFKKIAVEVGRNPDEITDDVIRAFVDTGDDGLTPFEREFGIKLTGGERQLSQATTPQQRSKALQMLDSEDSLRVGSSGGSRGQQEFLNQEMKRQDQLVNLVDSVAPEEALYSAPSQIKQGINSASDAALQKVDDAYAAIGEASLRNKDAAGLLEATRKTLQNNIDAVIDSEVTPATRAALKKIQEYEKYVKANPEKISVGRLDNIRKVIGSLWKDAKNKTDKSNMSQLMKAYDDYLDDAVIKGLFDGDQEAIEALKGARKLSREYFNKFAAREGQITRGAGQQIKDKQGRFIEKIIEADPTDQEVISALFTANRFGGAGASKMAARFKEILGSDSPAWKTVKQAAFRSLVKETNSGGRNVVSTQKTAQAIQKALKEQSELMNQIFTPQEIGRLRRLAAGFQNIDPNLGALKSRVTPSGKNAIKSAGDALKALFPGVAAGDPITLTASGVSIAKTLTGKNAAKAVFSPEQVRKASGGLLIPLPGGRQTTATAAAEGIALTAKD